jgi:hypothetical protein
MLRRILRLTFLLASLLFVGLPVFAYAECVPTHDCCPNGSLALCSIERSAAAPPDGAQPCCAVGPNAPATFAADASPNGLHKLLNHLPATLPFPAILTAHLVSARSRFSSTKPSFNPSYALLYLSTGRLRL